MAARTEYSRTWLDPVTGSRRTEVSATPLHYRDGQGRWQPVDLSVVDAASKPGGASDGWQNAAAAVDASLPVDARGAVRVGSTNDADRWVSVQLATSAGQRPAAATGSPMNGRVRYDEVLPGTSLMLTTTGDGVKEAVTFDSAQAVAALAGGAAAPSLTYTLRAAPGLRPVLAGDEVRVRDARGRTAFVLPAPFLDDAAGAHSDDVEVKLASAGPGQWQLRVAPSAAWLAAPARTFPVVLDPTIGYPSPMLGCGLSSTAPTTAACYNPELPLSRDSSGPEQRALLRFDTLLDVIPADALITKSDLQVYVPATGGAPTGAAASVDVRELTSPAAAGATWNTRNGTTAWTTPGGDRASLVSARTQLASDGSYQKFGVTELVQRWASGASTHHGFLLEKTSAAAGGAGVQVSSPTSGHAPSLYVEWVKRAGDRKGNSAVIDLDLTDRTSVSVNPASGNAAVTTRELSIKGTGLDLNVAHTSNSVGDTARLGLIGYGWSSSLDARLEPIGAATLMYVDGGGAQWLFHRAVDGTWTRPDGLDSDLVAEADGTYTLTARQSKVVETYTNVGTTSDPSYRLSQVSDRNGNHLTFTYDPTARVPFNNTRILRSVTDTRGRTLQVTNYGYFADSLTDVANRTVRYDRPTGNDLTAFTNTGGGVTHYEYDGAHRVTAVVAPGGQRTELTYDSSGRVLTLTRLDAGAPNVTWALSYDQFTRSNGVASTKTHVTDPNGNTSTYTSDGRGRVGTVLDARGNTRKTTYTPNDDVATTTGATAGASGGAQTTTNTYDNSGATSAAATWNLTSTRTPTGAGTQMTYGTGARRYDATASTDARGNQTTNAYDSAGNPTTSTTAGISTTNLYQGNTDPAYGGTVNCGPTVNGTITATKPGLLCEARDGAYTAGVSAAATTAHRTAYRYDSLGQLTKLLPGGPSAQQPQTFTYDSLSRLQTVTDGRGQTTYYGHDPMDRINYTQYGDGSADVTDFDGGDVGNGWVKATGQYPPNAPVGANPDQYTVYSRDDLGRLQYINAPQGGIDLNYDKASNLTSYADNGGATTYGYNTANQLTSAALPGGSCTGQSVASPGAASTLCVLFGVDNDGRRTLTRYPGGHTQANALDDSGRPTSITGTSAGTTRLQLGYTYTDSSAPADPANPDKDTSLVTAISDQQTSSTTRYSHDGLDRLTAASTAPTAGGAVTRYEGFCYDGAGNRTKTLNTAGGATCTTGTPASTATYNGANEQTGATGTTATGAPLTGTGFTYDGNGNQTTARSTTALTTTYNARAAASSFTPAGNPAIDQTYAGAGNGQRLTSGTTSFQPSPLSPAPARSTTGTTTTWAIRDPQGTLLALRIGTSPSTATAYYPFTDHLGSVRTLIRGDGTVANTYTYTSYGMNLTATEAVPQPYRYAQGYTDTTTGLIKLGVRYYDPTNGRFTQNDPTGQDPHYTYAGNNPTSYADPTGRWIDWGEIVVNLAKGVSNTAYRAAKKSAPLALGCFIWKSTRESDVDSLSDDLKDFNICFNPAGFLADSTN